MNKQPLQYTVTPADPAGHYFDLVLKISEPNRDGQVLGLPAWIPGSYMLRDFARHIIRLQAYCGKDGVEIATEKISNHEWQCAPCNGPLTIKYRVYAWDLSVRGAHFDESHAFFNGTSVFLLPLGYEQHPCLVQLNPPPHTNDWKVYTSLPEAQSREGAAKRHGFGLYEAPNYDALIDHPVEMGNPEVVSFEAFGAEHEMVFTGVLPNIDYERLIADTKKICEAQIALFEPDSHEVPFLDSADRYVFLTMVTGNDYGGLEHRSSTALMIGRHALPVIGQEPGNDYHDFLGLISHEYFHTWNVKRIKPAVFAPYQLFNENHTRLLWVFEGFTSYYDELMLWRSGAISEQTYLKRQAKVITNVWRGPGRHLQSVADSSFSTWTGLYMSNENSPNALVNYYTKGALIGLALDLYLRQESNNTYSLDDVMRLMWTRYGKTFYRGAQNQGVAEDEMPRLIREATQVDAAPFIERYVYGCDDLPLADLFKSQNIRLHWKASQKTPSMDVRTQADAEGLRLATVYNGGVAHQAGLSGGDRLVAINGLRVHDQQTFERALLTCRPEQKMPVHVFRRDELREFKVKLAPPATECHLDKIKN
ncbi:MAG TPA: PDZ domain-containing protein [Burkholderiaceae bacterium]|nr:PDZ domain-containing protein [Burkholderiaceae bacterium]